MRKDMIITCVPTGEIESIVLRFNSDEHSVEALFRSFTEAYMKGEFSDMEIKFIYSKGE